MDVLEKRVTQAVGLRGRMEWGGGPHKPSDTHGAAMQPSLATAASVAATGPTAGPRAVEHAVLGHPAGGTQPALLLLPLLPPQPRDLILIELCAVAVLCRATTLPA